MLRINPHYARMGKSYLFAEIAHRVAKFRADHPDTNVISMGIGDVTQPLVPCVIRRHGQFGNFSRLRPGTGVSLPA